MPKAVTSRRAESPEVARLRARLAEAEETLKAIRQGDVDAIAVDGPKGRRIFTLQGADEPYRIMLERMNEGAASLTHEGTIVFCNSRFAEMVGQPSEKLLGTAIMPFIVEGCRSHFKGMLARGVKADAREELLLQRADGTPIPVLASFKSIPLEKKRGACLVVSDLTHRNQLEQSLRESQAKLQLQFERMPIGCVTWDKDFRVQSWNPAATSIFGFAPEEAIGRHPYEFLVPRETQPAVDEIFSRLSHGDTTAHSINDNFTKDGRTITCKWTNTPLHDVHSHFVSILSMVEDITARKAAEDTLRRQAALLNLAHDAVIVRDLDGRLAFWNRGARDLYGWTEEEALGKITHELLQTSFPIPLKSIQRTILKAREWEGELRHIRQDGRRIVVASRWSLLRDEKGHPSAVLEINRDITARKETEDKLRDTSRYVRSLIEASLDPLVTISRDGKITDVNEATVKVTGTVRNALIGSDFCDYFTEPDKARAGYQHVFAEGSVRDYPLALRSTSGVVTDVLYNASIFRDETGAVEGVFAAARDVTERKQAEAEIRALNETLERRVQERTAELQAIFDTVPIGLAITNDSLGAHIRGNPAIEQMLGASSGGELSRSAKECAPYRILQDGHEPPAESLPMQRAARGETVAGELMEITRADGKVFTVHSVAAPLFDEQHRPRGAVGAFLDITDRKRAEEALRASEQSVRRKLDSILLPEGDLGNLELDEILDIPVIHKLLEEFYAVVHVTVGVIDHRGKVLAVPAWQEACMKFHRSHPESCKNCIESDVQLAAGVPPGDFKLYKCKNNLWDAATPIIIGDEHLGNLYFGQFFFTDEAVDYQMFREQAKRYGFDEQEYLKAIEAVPRVSRKVFDTSMTFLATFAKVISQLSYSAIKLARSMNETKGVNERLASLNKELESFNYAVAHDLRAPLRHIHGFSEILADEAKARLDESAQHHLQMIRDSVQHMEQLLEDLLSLSRLGRQELSKQVCGLQSLVEEVINTLKPDTKDRDVQWRVGELPFVDCDPGLMRQVILNLLANALKFTRPRPQAIIEVGQMLRDGEPVIFVRDNGVGFSMKYADKLFGLFQRLHRQQDFEGTGVGLAIVQRILHKHGGQVWAEAELNQGATFYFKLQTSANRTEVLKAIPQMA